MFLTSTSRSTIYNCDNYILNDSASTSVSRRKWFVSDHIDQIPDISRVAYASTKYLSLTLLSTKPPGKLVGIDHTFPRYDVDLYGY